MKLLIIKIFVVCIKLLYAPMKMRKTQNKILYLSRQSDEKSQDMILLEGEISRRNPTVKQIFRLRRLKDESAVSLSYIFSIIGDMWEMSSAKVVITDTYSIPVSCLSHKKDLQIIQIWHAMGAVKKFSLQAAGKAQGRDSGVAKAMCMHKNYDYVLAPSQATAQIYCQAFGCKKENIKILSLPRTDVILDGKNKREEFIQLNPEYRGKQIAVYVPTFRTDDDVYAASLVKEFSSVSDIGVVVSAHPLSKTVQKGLYKFQGDFSSLDLMKLADVVITDYSACSFEAALLNKPLYFYVPDYDIYQAEQGLNVDVKKELPSSTFENAKSIVEAIIDGNYDFCMLNSFTDKYIENKKTNNTEQVAAFICSLTERV